MEKKRISNKTKKIIIGIILLCPIILCTSTLDSDIWFQINHGRYLLANGFADIEPFTLHQGFNFSFEKWLTCIIYWLVYDNLGPNGIYLLVCLLTYITSVLLYKLCMKVSKNNWQISLVNTVLIMIPYTYIFARPRPQMFSIIIMLVEVLLLEKWVESKNNKYLIPLPFLSCLYMQLHSTMWPMFFICMMPYLFDFKFIKFNKIIGTNNKKIPLLVTLLLSLLAGLINPYGLTSCVYLVKSLMGGSFAFEINELKKTTVSSALRLSVVFAPQLYYLVFTNKKLPLRYLYFILGTLLMALVAIRNQAFYLILAGFITSYMYQELTIDHKLVDVVLKLGLVTTILCCGGMGYYRMFMRDPYKMVPYKDLIDTLVQQYDGKNKTIFTDFSYGNYCEFAGMKAYLDARAEVFIPEINGKEDILLEYNNLLRGKIHYSQLEEKYHFDYWLIEKGTLLDTYLSKDDNYKVILENNSFKIMKYQN